MPTSTSEDRLRERALAIGFDVCRFASVEDAWGAGDRLHAFLGEGRHGTMDWMERTAERRAHPRALWGEARSAVVLGLNYGPDHDPRDGLADPGRANISVYARGDDYHELIKGRLKTLAGWMVSRLGGELKVFVDTAPLMEKPLAEAAGLGWQGKHTNLVSREFGSWLFLGVILTDLRLDPDPPVAATCGGCTACLRACPTDAFPAPYQLDARRCLSYLTIEHAGPWPEPFRIAVGNRVYGCDDCLAACPWNKFAQRTHETRLRLRDDLRDVSLGDLLDLDDERYRALFRKSPIKRIGLKRFLRNVLYAAGNSGDGALIPRARQLCDDADPVVADAARWAVGRLEAAVGTRSGPRQRVGIGVSPR